MSTGSVPSAGKIYHPSAGWFAADADATPGLMVGEYLGRIFLSQNKKPQFTIRRKFDS